MRKTLLGLFIFITLSFVFCKKEVELYQLTVVTTFQSIPVDDAKIHLYDANFNGVNVSRRTDENGEVCFIFEQVVHAEIEITKGSARSCTSEIISKGHKTIYIELKPFSQQATNGC